MVGAMSPVQSGLSSGLSVASPQMFVQTDDIFCTVPCLTKPSHHESSSPELHRLQAPVLLSLQNRSVAHLLSLKCAPSLGYQRVGMQSPALPWKSEDNVQPSEFFFHLLHPPHRTRVMGLGSRVLAHRAISLAFGCLLCFVL